MANYSRYTNTPLITYYVQFRSELKKTLQMRVHVDYNLNSNRVFLSVLE